MTDPMTTPTPEALLTADWPEHPRRDSLGREHPNGRYCAKDGDFWPCDYERLRAALARPSVPEAATALKAVRDILTVHIIRVARYYRASHIETFSNEAVAIIDEALERPSVPVVEGEELVSIHTSIASSEGGSK